MPDEMRKEVMKNTGDLCKPLEDVFLRIDNELRLLDAEQAGSTACVCLVRQEFGHKILYVANVGDSRAVISKNGVAERLSVDHKATDPGEIERIKAGGGMILGDRVGGSLAVTRAFGDHALKSEGVTAKPTINKHVLRPFDKFLIIASDGVWDVLEDQDAVNFCNDQFSAKDIVRQIIKTTIEKGSKDNISCIVVKFHASSPF